MKNIIYFMMLCSFLFISCKRGKNISYPTIPTKEAIQMIQHYKDEGVSHNAADIIRYIRFKNKDMKELFDRDGTITFWTAANLATNKSFIIIEYNEDPHSPDPAPVFYSMEALGVTICPPPDTPPCDTETLSL